METRETEFVERCVQAVTLAANDLGLDPELLAAELAHGEIGLLVSCLRAAAPHAPDPAVRADAEALLYRLTTWTARED